MHSISRWHAFWIASQRSRQRQPSSFRDQLLQRFPECLLHWLVCLVPSVPCCPCLGTGDCGRGGLQTLVTFSPVDRGLNGQSNPGSSLQCPCCGPVDRIVQQLTDLRWLKTSGCSMMMIDDGAKQQRKVGCSGPTSKQAGSNYSTEVEQSRWVCTAGSSCIRGCSSPLLGSSLSPASEHSASPRKKPRGLRVSTRQNRQARTADRSRSSL